jgi:uncharacterized protein YegP (UPF0339 family)
VVKARVWQSNKDSHFYFDIVGDNGETVASSEGYVRRIDAVDEARKLVGDAPVDVIED